MASGTGLLARPPGLSILLSLRLAGVWNPSGSCPSRDVRPGLGAFLGAAKGLAIPEAAAAVKG